MCKKCKCKKCSDCSDAGPVKKCCAGKIACIVFMSILFGCLIGVHKNVIKAIIKGEEMPEAPVWHFWCR
jgi:hypothetical protein